MDISSAKHDSVSQFVLCERLSNRFYTEKVQKSRHMMCRIEKRSYSRVLREKIFFQNKCPISQTLSCFVVLSITSSNNSEFHSMNKRQDWAQYLHYKLHPLEDLKALYKNQLIKPDSPLNKLQYATGTLAI